MSFSSERLAFDLHHPDGELSSKLELVVSMFEGTDAH